MKIALISVQYIGAITGGGGIHVVNLSRELAKQGFDVTVLCMGIDDLPEYEEIRVGEKKVYVYRFWTKDSRFLSNPFEGSKTDEIKRLEEFKALILDFLSENRIFDIVHLHGHFMVPSLARDLKEMNYPAKIITTFHAFESVSETLKGTSSKELYNYIIRKERDAISYSDVIILLSRSLIGDVLKIHGDILEKSKIRIIPNGIDPMLIHRKKSPEKIIALRNKIKSDYLLFNINRIDPSKKIEFILKSLPLVHEKIPEKKIFLLIAGKLEERNRVYRDKLIKISEQLMRDIPQLTIKITENISDEQKILYYDASDIFITASPIEPFGMTILESIVRGTPVAIVEAPGPREIFNIDFDLDSSFIETPAGVIAKFGNENEVISNLANAISYLLKNLSRFKERIKNYREEIISKYSWTAVVKMLSKIYREK